MKKNILHLYSFSRRNWRFISIVIFGFLFSQQVSANGGYGNTGVIIQKNGASKTPYIVNSGFNNDSFCSWYTLNGAQAFNTYNFGSVSALVLNGMVIDGWTDNADFVTGQVEYRIWLQSGSRPASATSTFNVGGYGSACSVQDVQCSSGNNRRVGWDGSSVNLLSGLAPGVYNFEIISHSQLRYNCGSWNQADNAAVTATFTVSSSATDNYRSKATGNWNTAGSWESSPNNVNWGTATLVPDISASSITIQSGHNITLNGNATISGLTINSGGTFTASDVTPRTLTISKSSAGTITTLNNSGSWSNGSGGSTVVFTGAPASGDAIQGISGTIAFQNITLNKTGGSSNVGASFGAGTSLTGTLEIGSGGYISTDPPNGFYGTGAILKFNQGVGATYQVNSGDKTWSTTEIPQNITVNSGTVQVNENRVATGSLIIGSGATLTISASKHLSINTELTNNGTLNLLSDASGTATILTPPTIGGTTGAATVQQNLASTRNWYISSPVSGNLPSGYTYYKYDEPGNNTGYSAPATAYWESVSSGTAATMMKGYIVQAASTSIITFTGTALNTGDKSIGLTRTAGKTKEGFNLVGNPYPSFINIDNLASNTDIIQSYWYRSYNGGYVFDTYNIPSGVSTGNSGLAVSNCIPPMQAFWVRVANGKSTATLNLLNANRTHQDNVNNKFRTPAIKNINQQVLRLQVSDGTYSDETVLYSNPKASNDYDQYDSDKMSNANPSIPEIYTAIGSEQLVINGMNTVPLDTEIPLGFTTGQQNTFSIRASEITNFDSSIRVILNDNQNVLNPETDITNSPYSFSSDITNSTTRFSIIFKSASISTKTTDLVSDGKLIIYKSSANQITINCNELVSKDASVSVSNVLGQKLLTKQITASSTIMNIPNDIGVYIVTITNNGKNYSGKLIFN